MDKIFEILKYIWQLPQHIIALLYYGYIKDDNLLSTGQYKDAVVFTWNACGSMTLGKYIFLSPRATDNTLKHEYGHTRQSLMLGPLYLIVIGFPSIIWAAIHKTIAPSKSYSWFYTEKWADKLGGAE